MSEVKAPEVKAKIVIKDMGNPKKASALEAGQRHYLGRMSGFASSTVQKVGNNGDPVTGMKGQFKAVRAEDRAVIQSGVAYLPTGIQELITEAIPDGDGRVQFVLDIYSQPASNPIGYEYVAVSAAPVKQEDAFAALEAEAKPMPALPAPTPAKDAAKAKDEPKA